MSDTFFGLDITKSLFHKSDNDQKEDAEHLEALLKDVLIHQQKHSGHVHLIELKKIRHQMDKSWEKSRKQIETKIHKVLDQYMLSEDLYARYNDTSYIVVFGSLYETEAHIKCRLICKEIAIALLGEEAEENVVEVMAITEGDEGRLDIQPLSRVDNLVHDMVQSTNQIPLDDEGTGLRNLKFIYRPLLSVRTNVVSTFMCIPVRETQPGRFLSGYDVLDDPTDSYQICNLDLETLNTITHEFDHLVETGARSLMAIPVHFETLSDRKLCGEYLKFCEPVASKHSKRIIFEIIGLPSGIPQSRLQELTSYLQIKSRAVIARLRVEDPNFSPLWAVGLHAVGIDVYRSDIPESKLFKIMDDFARKAKKHGVKSYIHGVGSISLYTAAISSGFDYVSGYALSAITDAAEDIRAHEAKDTYLALLKEQTNT